MKVKVKVNRVRVNRVTASRNTTPMIRGLSWALASCTTSSSEEDRNTMKVSMAPARVPSSDSVEDGSKPARQPARTSIQCRPLTASTATIMPSTGMIQMEFRK